LSSRAGFEINAVGAYYYYRKWYRRLFFSQCVQSQIRDMEWRNWSDNQPSPWRLFNQSM